MLSCLARPPLGRLAFPLCRRLAAQPAAQPSSDSATASSLEARDFFGVQKLFTTKTLFDARMHLGHTVRSLNPQMNKYLFGSRFDMCVLDLDQTAVHLRQALNFTAHIAYRGGIVLFVCRQPPLVHMVDRAAQDCGEFSCSMAWQTEIFTAPTMIFGQEVRLPDLVVMVHTKDKVQYRDHPAIIDAAKVGIPTLGLVDTDCNPSLITFPVPGNDDSQDSVQLFLNLVKQAVLLGKERRKAEQGEVQEGGAG